MITLNSRVSRDFIQKYQLKLYSNFLFNFSLNRHDKLTSHFIYNFNLNLIAL